MKYIVRSAIEDRNLEIDPSLESMEQKYDGMTSSLDIFQRRDYRPSYLP